MQFIDRCIFNATAGGLTDWSVASAVLGFMTPVQAGAVIGQVYSYSAQSADLTQWEEGQGPWNGAQLARSTIFWSSTGGGKVVFTSAPQVSIQPLAEDLVPFTPTVTGLAPASGGGTLNFLRADGTWAAPATGFYVFASSFGVTFNGSTDDTAAWNACFASIMATPSKAGTVVWDKPGTSRITGKVLIGLDDGSNTHCFISWYSPFGQDNSRLSYHGPANQFAVQVCCGHQFKFTSIAIFNDGGATGCTGLALGGSDAGGGSAGTQTNDAVFELCVFGGFALGVDTGAGNAAASELTFITCGFTSNGTGFIGGDFNALNFSFIDPGLGENGVGIDTGVSEGFHVFGGNGTDNIVDFQSSGETAAEISIHNFRTENPWRMVKGNVNNPGNLHMFGCAHKGQGSPQICQIASHQDTTSVTTLIDVPAGSLIIVALYNDNTPNRTISTITDNATGGSNTYTSVSQPAAAGGYYNSAIFACLSTANDLPSGSTITISPTDNYNIEVFTAAGGATLGPVASTNSTGTSVSLTTGALVANPTLIIAGSDFGANPGIVTPPSAPFVPAGGVHSQLALHVQIATVQQTAAVVFNPSWVNSAPASAVLATFYLSSSSTWKELSQIDAISGTFSSLDLTGNLFLGAIFVEAPPPNAISMINNQMTLWDKLVTGLPYFLAIGSNQAVTSHVLLQGNMDISSSPPLPINNLQGMVKYGFDHSGSNIVSLEPVVYQFNAQNFFGNPNASGNLYGADYLALNHVRQLAEGPMIGAYTGNSLGNTPQSGLNLRVMGTFATSATLTLNFQRTVSVETLGGGQSLELVAQGGAVFFLSDVGKPVLIAGQGTNGWTDWHGQVTLYVDPTHVWVQPTSGQSPPTIASPTNAVIGANEPDGNYMVLVTGNANETFWVTGIGTSGFTVHSSNASSTATVTCLIVR